MKLITQNTIYRRIIIGFLTLLAISAVGAAFVNKGFFHSEFKEQVRVEILNTEEIATERLIDTIRDIDGIRISRIDRLNNEIFIENQELAEVRTALFDNLADEDLVNVQILNVEGKNLLEIAIPFAYFWIFAFFFYIVFAYLTIYLRNENLNLQDIAKIFGLQALAYGLTGGLVLTVIQVFSLFYQVKFTDLTVFGILPLVIVFVFVAANYFAKEEVKTKFNELIVSSAENIFKINRLFVLTSALVLATIGFGLGPNFILPAFFFFAAFVIFGFVNSVLSKEAALDKPMVKEKEKKKDKVKSEDKMEVKDKDKPKVKAAGKKPKSKKKSKRKKKR